MFDFKMIINGKKVSTVETFDVINPANETVIAKCPMASEKDLDDAVEAARKAFPSWSSTGEEERARLIHAIGQAFDDNAEELARLVTLEQGKPFKGFAGLGARFEIGGAVVWSHATADMSLPVEVIQDNDDARIEIHRKPLGVVGSITPWNYPLLIAIWHTVPALRAGNTVVIKPSEYTPLAVMRAAEMINEILPSGVFNVVTGDGALGAAMARHKGIDKIVFTGSTQTGKKVMQDASSNLKRLTLELGGNDAAIVLPDVDVEKIAPKIFAAAMINNGQTCAAIKRLYVHESVYDELCNSLAEIANNMVSGNGETEVDFGPIQNRAQFEKVCAIAEDAKARGARFLSGGEPGKGPGYFFPVTIAVDVPEDARLVTEEPFGPILPILRFSDIEEVLEKANATSVGLGGSVWSTNTERATHIATRLECGTAWVNNHAALQPNAPFGGVKESGFGVEFGTDGLKEFTVLQTVQIAKK